MSPIVRPDPALIPDRVLWHEGLLLAPQHFQEAARRQERLLAYRLGTAAPFAFGVARLELDRVALADGLVRVTALEAIMPDGLVVIHPHRDSPALELDLASCGVDPAAGSIAIHLGVARADGPGPNRRYRDIETDGVIDQTAPDNAIAVARSVPVPVLLATSAPLRPPPERHVSLPLAVIARAEGAVTPAPFDPPRLWVAGGSPLHEIASGVAAELRQRATVLTLQQNNEGGAGGSGEAEILRALTAGLPRLEALLGVDGAPPFELYLALCDVLGAVACLGGQPFPPQLRAYEHRDARASFEALQEPILRALRGIAQPYRLRRFVKAEPGRFTIVPSEGDVLATPLLALRPPPGQAQGVTAWLSAAILASASALPSIRERRTLGIIRLPATDGALLGFAAPRDVLLFALRADPDQLRPGEPLELIGGAAQGARVPPEEAMLLVPAGAAEG